MCRRRARARRRSSIGFVSRNSSWQYPDGLVHRGDRAAPLHLENPRGTGGDPRRLVPPEKLDQGNLALLERGSSHLAMPRGDLRAALGERKGALGRLERVQRVVQVRVEPTLERRKRRFGGRELPAGRRRLDVGMGSAAYGDADLDADAVGVEIGQRVALATGADRERRAAFARARRELDRRARTLRFGPGQSQERMSREVARLDGRLDERGRTGPQARQKLVRELGVDERGASLDQLGTPLEHRALGEQQVLERQVTERVTARDDSLDVLGDRERFDRELDAVYRVLDVPQRVAERTRDLPDERPFRGRRFLARARRDASRRTALAETPERHRDAGFVVGEPVL